MKPAIRSQRLSLSTSPIRLWAEDAVGYRPDDDVADWQRTVLKGVVAVGAMAACALTVWALNRGGLPRIPKNTSSILRLDDFTRRASHDDRNTMPAFLALPGDLGALSADGSSIREVDGNSLADVVCAPSLAVLVRQEFPGYYERIPDDRLEKLVLEKHPDYRDRLCALPPWMDATAHDIIKYQLKPLPPFRASVVLCSVLSVTAFVVVVLNIYYRLLVPVAGHALTSHTDVLVPQLRPRMNEVRHQADARRILKHGQGDSPRPKPVLLAEKRPVLADDHGGNAVEQDRPTAHRAG
jgi:hypothetical protein